MQLLETMPDLQNLNATKERITSFIQEKGPSLPVQIASHISSSPIFASAFLSELYAEGRVKISNMRVGSSPLYYLKGQEEQLENFVSHLNHKEKEAFFLLKEKKLLEDEKQEPAIRVALRQIKDFAVPLKIRINEESKFFWKHFLLPENEIKEVIQSMLPPEKKKIENKKDVDDENKSDESQVISDNKKEKKKRIKPKESNFAQKIKDYLIAKDIELLEIIFEKKKDFNAKVRIDTMLGKQEYYLIAKDKKKINPDDLTLALQKAQTEKMPALLISPGEMDNKAILFIKDWKNMLKFDKIKL